MQRNLLSACEFGLHRIVALLVQHGADMAARHVRGKRETCAELATETLLIEQRQLESPSMGHAGANYALLRERVNVNLPRIIQMTSVDRAEENDS